MITISGVQRPIDTTSWSPAEIKIYEQKKNSTVTYDYETVQQLRFEMTLRAAIVAEAIALSQSGLRFADFDKAKCNEDMWTLTDLGGFLIRDDRSPAAGIRDIFANGDKYATECATAAVIAVYQGVLDSIRETDFNRLFAGLLLYDWHTNKNLRLSVHTDIEESYPGDLLYFNNPDFSPDTPVWRGENVIKIGDDLYYGHPFGIAPSQTIINGLNNNRRPGSSQTAYLTETVTQPGYVYLSQYASNRRSFISARIGLRYFISPV
ncbi:protein-glutamine gamma-glutamyltransferase [Cohnella herbarum]|uniref:Protein-glutamine gamma-glutamyltransferase n=1 Tax=Cohnella herbarum TaxID=2728023 RepID=A0A7Z2ZQR9_9BACL|nr:protein-glutamine gamma-glutamyltransferase [Cohnella herbarum]QJD87322.1 protein-glutamine gamma-glutamyltransferase [Cohnella herbarum]